jgi:malate dehydrogenase (oxaloacetate-decarboxylating)(NADP+)
VERRLERLGLRLGLGRDVELVDPEGDPRYNEYWTAYHRLMARSGITPETARTMVRTNTTVIGALMLALGHGDALLCGATGAFDRHLRRVVDILGLKAGVRAPHAMQALVLAQGTVFIADSNIAVDPDAEEIAAIVMLAAAEVRRFGLPPKVALVSHSNFGSSDAPSAVKMREALTVVRRLDPELDVEGEMKGDAALSQAIREQVFPQGRFTGAANLLVMPNLDAANISINLVRQLADGISVGPILLGVGGAAHVVSATVTVRGLLNMSAVAVAHAQDARAAEAGRAPA